ncbi:MAG: choice-of-anchor J domain-containing protein [bacterium]|nr:choice-of-anchor J domain-containing protein [bacterium]
MKKLLTVCIMLALVATAAMAGKETANLSNQVPVSAKAIAITAEKAATLNDASLWATAESRNSLDDCAVPFPEGAEAPTVVPALPACWTEISVDASSPAATWGTSTGSAKTGTQKIRISWSAPALDDYLISPAVTLTGGTSYDLKFWRRAASSSYSEQLTVLLSSTTPDVAGLSTVIKPLYSFNSVTYVQDVVTFTPSVTGVHYIGWRATSLDALGIYLDDITLELTPQTPGRCCYGTDPCAPLCADLLQADCAALGGSFDPATTCTATPCPVPLPGDLCCNALPIPGVPYSVSGTTAGYNDNYHAVCPYNVTGAPDVTYGYTPAVDQLVTFSLCLSGYDTKIYIYDGAPVPGGESACNDDASPCPGATGNYRSYLECVQLYAGHSYCIVVDGYSSADFGDYTLTLEECTPCDVVCPPEATPEGEPVCFDGYDDIYNGGCNDVFGGSITPIDCGALVCGTYGTHLNSTGAGVRDTDWYLLNVADDNDSVFVCVAGDAPTQLAIIPVGDCNALVILYNVVSLSCETQCFVGCLPAGQYWIFVASAAGNTVACGSQYVLQVGCMPCSEPFVCHCGEAANSHCTYAVDNTTYPIDSALPPTVVTINVPIEYQITDLNVCLDIVHTYDGDLGITLTSPLGTVVTLSYQNGGGGDNFTCTTFDDEASTAVALGVAPFSGSFQPDSPLSAVDGENAVGNWTLTITDYFGGDVGWLNNVCLEFTYDIILPVAFGSLDVVAGDREVTLNWNTMSETNVAKFEILRDGAKVGEVAATNNATGSTYSFTDENLTNGTAYSYNLVSVDVTGARQELATQSATPSFGSAVVSEYALHQNYPNPFNPTTNIAFDMVEAGNVNISVFNLLGQKVAELVNGRMEAGRHVVAFDAATLSSGLYLYKMDVNGLSFQQKMVLMK